MKTLRKFMLIMATTVLLILVGCIANQVYNKDNITDITQTGTVMLMDIIALVSLYRYKEK